MNKFILTLVFLTGCATYEERDYQQEINQLKMLLANCQGQLRGCEQLKSFGGVKK